MDSSQLNEKYQFWLNHVDEADKAELQKIENSETEIEDRFYCDLSFGTAGMRGVMGLGTNRMNVYTVRKATFGLAAWLKQKGLAERGIAIAWDTRNQSATFAEEAALTMAACGIKSYLFTIPSATPLLSFAVRDLQCGAGIVITASHNTKEYNGYKVYDQTGCQMVSEAANEVAALVAEASPFQNIAKKEQALAEGLLLPLGKEMLERFCAAASVQAHGLSAVAKAALKVVYTPIHGTGTVPVTETLKQQGYRVDIVKEQATADGNFPTVKKPNPEEREALTLAINRGLATDADLVLGTDPDCDRVGIAVRDNDGFNVLSGNQIGALLVNYLILRRKEGLKDNAVVLKSIVTNDFGAAIARKNGVKTVETLTGFKYIGEAITAYQDTGEYDFLMGYEESYGFLVGTHVRDKDAVVASLLICEMAAYFKEQGYSLSAILKSLHHRFGYYLDAVDSYAYEGSAGKAKIESIMATLRGNTDVFPGETVTVNDYACGINGLPAANVLKYCFDDGSWVAVRPSGTEPKLKIYYSIKGKDRREASSRLVAYSDILSELL